MPHTYRHPHPALTVDAVVFGLDAEGLRILLIQRDQAPFAGRWALPGGFVHIDESLDEAVRRELREETGIGRIYLEQLYTYGDPGRDPRERVVTVAYVALVRPADHHLAAATDARDCAWFPVGDLPTLAFDHEHIVADALQRLRRKVRYHPIGFELLPPLFTLTQLQRLYEIILDRPLDKRNFRKKVQAMGILEETDELERDGAHRAARLYRFDAAAYQRMVEEGFNFEI